MWTIILWSSAQWTDSPWNRFSCHFHVKYILLSFYDLFIFFGTIGIPMVVLQTRQGGGGAHSGLQEPLKMRSLVGILETMHTNNTHRSK
jgi:hypothetical protein